MMSIIIIIIIIILNSKTNYIYKLFNEQIKRLGLSYSEIEYTALSTDILVAKPLESRFYYILEDDKLSDFYDFVLKHKEYIFVSCENKVPITTKLLPNLLTPQLIPDIFMSEQQIKSLIEFHSPLDVTLELYSALKGFLYGKRIYHNSIDKIYEYMELTLLESYYCININIYNCIVYQFSYVTNVVSDVTLSRIVSLGISFDDSKNEEMLCNPFNKEYEDVIGGVIYYIFDENEDLDVIVWMLDILYDMNSNSPINLFFVYIYIYYINRNYNQ